MHTTLLFFKTYPKASLITLFAFLFSGIAEGIGLLSFIPLLYLAMTNTEGHSPDADIAVMKDVEILKEISEALGDYFSIGYILVAIFVGLTLKNYLILLANRQIGFTSAKIAYDFRVRVLRSIYRSRWEYFASQPTGYFSGRLTNEVKRAASTYMNSAMLVAFIAQCITYLVIAAVLSPGLTVIAIAVALLAYVLSKRFISQSRSHGLANTRHIKEIAKRAVDSIHGIKAIKAMGKEAFLESEFLKEISDLRDAQSGQVLASQHLNLWQNEIVLFFMLLGLFGSFYTDWISPVEVLLLAAVLMRFFSQTSRVTSQLQKLASSESAYYSLNEFLEHAQANGEVAHGGSQPTLEKGIQFSGVSFRYETNDVLHGAEFSFPANRITTLVGPSGAGKTTILDLVVALMEPREGKILVDDIPMESLDVSKWRQMIGYVPQEPFLLHESIFDNVTLGDESISRKQVVEALAEANADEFVNQLEGGMDFNVGERGSRLSGGQRQRVMIARALIKKPSLVIFDEATSSLDSTSEREICNTILSLRGSHTIICASHRPLLVDAADQVISL